MSTLIEIIICHVPSHYLYFCVRVQEEEECEEDQRNHNFGECEIEHPALNGHN